MCRCANVQIISGNHHIFLLHHFLSDVPYLSVRKPDVFESLFKLNADRFIQYRIHDQEVENRRNDRAISGSKPSRIFQTEKHESIVQAHGEQVYPKINAWFTDCIHGGSELVGKWPEKTEQDDDFQNRHGCIIFTSSQDPDK